MSKLFFIVFFGFRAIARVVKYSKIDSIKIGLTFIIVVFLNKITLMDEKQIADQFSESIEILQIFNTPENHLAILEAGKIMVEAIKNGQQS